MRTNARRAADPGTADGPSGIVVTGVAGYIGSHTALTLLDRGHHVFGIDNMSHGHPWVVDFLRQAGGARFDFAEADVLDRARLVSDFRAWRPGAVIHFAGLTSVAESVSEPLRYWRNNLAGSLSLLAAMRETGVSKIVFSSTAATYGVPDPGHLPIAEGCPQRPINPYGRSKLAFEQVLVDECAAGGDMPLTVAILRYFNVAGCDPQGRLGEDHRPETHLIPICLDAALGRRDRVDVFGEDYPTPDGTCIRDYVHVTDLADAHLLAMAKLDAPKTSEPFIANVGIGRGFSVREVLESCRRVTGKTIAHRVAPRRAGDPPALFADASRLERELKWTPRFTSLDETVATAWAWRRAHPDGYPSKLEAAGFAASRG